MNQEDVSFRNMSFSLGSDQTVEAHSDDDNNSGVFERPLSREPQAGTFDKQA